MEVACDNKQLFVLVRFTFRGRRMFILQFYSPDWKREGIEEQTSQEIRTVKQQQNISAQNAFIEDNRRQNRQINALKWTACGPSVRKFGTDCSDGWKLKYDEWEKSANRGIRSARDRGSGRGKNLVIYSVLSHRNTAQPYLDVSSRWPLSSASRSIRKKISVLHSQTHVIFFCLWIRSHRFQDISTVTVILSCLQRHIGISTVRLFKKFNSFFTCFFDSTGP